jgi:hypothetical protein
MHTATRRTGSVLAALVAVLTLAVLAVATAPARAANHSQMQNKERPWFSGPVCLEIDNARYTSGSAATVEWCDQRGLQMEWSAVPVTGTGYVQLKVAHTGMCLDVSGGQYTEGAQVVQAYCQAGRQSQEWKFVWKSWANGMAYYEVVARHSGKCLDKSGWNVVQWNCHGGDWQQWSRPVNA